MGGDEEASKDGIFKVEFGDASSSASMMMSRDGCTMEHRTKDYNGHSNGMISRQIAGILGDNIILRIVIGGGGGGH
ncbi:4539_t:CDS:2 [Paraglomus occultum]|uniref:4539_t:CDS:1 n=1 Tax=Paraglomus occultum TaxID=144539 RepID=A0A9N9CTL8_9GLOM|nr:4539_t:CDS:2 [Paraglomus occultum]